MKFFFVTFALLISVCTVHAIENQEYELKENNIITENNLNTNKSSQKPLKSVSESFNSTYIITQEMIKQSSSNSLADLLNMQPGITVDNSGFGHPASVRLNGGLSQHVLILLDGVKVENPNSPQSFFDIGQIPIEFIEEIEITQGPSSVLYGNGAISGVINLKTKKYKKDTAVIKQEFGTDNTYNTQMGINVNIDKFNLTIFGTYYYTKGYSLADKTNDNRTLDDDGAKIKDINIRGVYDISDTSYIEGFYKNRFSYFEDDLINNPINISSPVDAYDNYVNKQEELSYFKYGFTLFDNFTNEIRLSQYLTDTTYQDLSSTDDNLYNTFNSKEQIINYKASYVWDNIVLIAGSDLEDKNADIDNITKQVNDWAVYANTKEYINDVLMLEQGFRYNRNQRNITEQNTQFSDDSAYNLGLQYNIPSIYTAFKVNYGTGYRLPSLYELFAESYGNSNLDAEYSKGINIGITNSNFADNFGTVSLDIFYSNVYDMIYFSSTSYKNVGNYLNKGFNLSMPFTISNFNILPTYTYLNQTDISNNSSVLLLPKHKITINIDYAISNRTTIVWQSIYATEVIDNVAKDEAINLPSYFVNNTLLYYDLKQGSKFYFKINNLFNTQYQTSYGYQSQDRSYYFGILYGV